jgi:hypothetical protein
VVIDAPDGIVDEPKRPATMRLLDRERRDDYNGPVGIALRGHSTLAEDPKNAYEVETRDAAGDDRNVSLLGMPEDDDWVLIASYKDESLLRNFVAYSAARWLGRYAPRTRLVEVFVDNSYEGVYLLAEKLKLHDGRVAVDDSGISGGYLLKMVSPDRAPGEDYFTTPVRRQPIVYADPNRSDLPYARADWIRDYVNRFERTLYGDRFKDRRRGYRRYLDVNAAVDFVLLNELFRNRDTFTYSTYMHKGTGGRLALGPLWDFDHALGNYESRRQHSDAQFNLVGGWQHGASPWCERLYRDPGFRSRLAARWRELRADGLLRHIKRTIDRGARQLAAAQERNFSRWPVFGTDEVYPDDPRTGSPPANHAQAVDYLKWWVVSRVQWIDANVNNLRP